MFKSFNTLYCTFKFERAKHFVNVTEDTFIQTINKQMLQNYWKVFEKLVTNISWVLVVEL